MVHTTHIAPGLMSGAGLRQYGESLSWSVTGLVDEGRGLVPEFPHTAPETFAEPRGSFHLGASFRRGMIYESVCDPADRRF
ncbi:MAG: hypothetical protein CM1200mP36_07480 [Gammaproteobacteria bacterium]|nr:MAG: hypothetical protein CM1200mP36_07480 [Gammaproteobacteria bacterium]